MSEEIARVHLLQMRRKVLFRRMLFEYFKLDETEKPRMCEIKCEAETKIVRK